MPTNPQVFGFTGKSATNCPVQLLPMKQCKLTVSFIPAGRRFYTDMVTVYDNAANSPQTIPLSGTGK
jgi:hypothetical protein